MKHVHGNGARLEVRDCGPVIMTLRKGPYPIKFNGHAVLDDDDARQLVRQLMDAGAIREP